MTVAWDHCPERFLGSVNEALQGGELVEFGRATAPSYDDCSLGPLSRAFFEKCE